MCDRRVVPSSSWPIGHVLPPTAITCQVDRQPGERFDDLVAKCHCYTMGSSISIKQLHQATGEHVRRAAASRAPIQVTDRGKPVAALVNPSLLTLPRRRRTLLAEYKALLSGKQKGDVLADLDAVRGDPESPTEGSSRAGIPNRG
jgi:hypothetical protein